ncbi:putative ribonuclease H-like domain-containing protein [Tanacetum coccineum]
MTKNLKEHGLFSSLQQRTNHKDFKNCLCAFFLSQEEPKKVIQALKDPSWIESLQDEAFLQLSYNRFGPWWIYHMAKGPLVQNGYRNKKDERGIMIKNKARLVAQGYTQCSKRRSFTSPWREESTPCYKMDLGVGFGRDVGLFLAYASYKDFVVYQMDVKSAFLYGKIKKEFYVCQPLGVEDQTSLDRVIKVERHFMDCNQATRACDYAEASLDKKSIAGGCQFLGCRLISWLMQRRDLVLWFANSILKLSYINASIAMDRTLRLDITSSEDSNKEEAYLDDQDSHRLECYRGSGQPNDLQHTSTSAQPSNEEPITVPSSSQPKKTHRPRKAKRAAEIS